MLNARVEVRSLVTEGDAGELLHSVTSASQLEPSLSMRSQDGIAHTSKINMLSMLMEEHGSSES
jgi:hypothetical protein